MAVLVNKQAPDFKAEAATGGNDKKTLTLSEFKDKKYVVLFFYTLDFTFVCPTEIHVFQDPLGEFESRNAQVIGVSVDSVNSHQAWLRTPKNDGGIQGVGESYVDYVERSSLEMCAYYVARGDFENAQRMLTRTWSESLIGNDGD